MKQVPYLKIARALNLSTSSVRYHVIKHGLPRDTIEAAVAWYENYKQADPHAELIASEYDPETDKKKPGRPQSGTGTARDRKTSLECEKLEIAIAKAKGELIPRDEVAAMLAKMGAQLNALTRTILTRRIAVISGYPVEHIIAWGAEHHETICEKMKTSVEEWDKHLDKKYPQPDQAHQDD